MRTSFPLAMLLAVALTACAEGVPLPLDRRPAEARPAHASAGARPLAGRCATTFNPPPLPPPPVHRQVDTGTCEMAHLGATTVHGVQEINFAAGTQSGERTFTAANGDRLRATHVGTSRPGGPGLIRFSAVITFAGGTGRFEGAAGQARAEGTANLVTRTTSFQIVDGWIHYTASDRR